MVASSTAGAPPGAGGLFEATLPDWIDELEAAVWVVDTTGTLRHANEHARSLLGLHAESIGEPCHAMLQGRDETGDPLCEKRCRLRRAVEHGQPVPPLVMRRFVEGREQALVVVPIPVTVGALGPLWIVHVAVDATSYWRSVAFLQAVARDRPDPIRPAAIDELSPREQQILSMLSEGEGVKRIAYRLGLRHTTVRNHVQHILRKLRACSMLEAIAVHLLRRSMRSNAGTRQEGTRPSS